MPQGLRPDCRGAMAVTAEPGRVPTSCPTLGLLGLPARLRQCRVLSVRIISPSSAGTELLLENTLPNKSAG